MNNLAVIEQVLRQRLENLRLRVDNAKLRKENPHNEQAREAEVKDMLVFVQSLREK